MRAKQNAWHLSAMLQENMPTDSFLTKQTWKPWKNLNSLEFVCLTYNLLNKELIEFRAQSVFSNE